MKEYLVISKFWQQTHRTNMFEPELYWWTEMSITNQFSSDSEKTSQEWILFQQRPGYCEIVSASLSE